MTQPDVHGAPPPADSRQSIVDDEHLRLLGLGYLISAIISAGFSLMGLLYAAMGAVISKADFAAVEGQGGPPPDFIFWMMGAFGMVFFLMFVTMAVLKFLTYRFLLQRRHRLFCMTVAAITCLGIPWGTALGVCTFLVMNRRSVEALFKD
jgi:hypothetical protein